MIFLLGIIVTIILFVVLGFYEDDDYHRTWKIRPLQAIALVGLLISVVGCIKSVPTGHTGVVTTFGKVEDYTYEAGIHFTSPFINVVKIDNRTQKQTMELSVFSSDIQEVSVVYTLNYSIDKANAQNLYKTVGLSYYETVIQPKIAECVKSVMAKYTAENLVGSRSEVAKKIEDMLAESLKPYNINVISTSIEDIDFTDVFTDAVEAKQVAEQNKIREQTEAETKVLKAEADAKVKIIEAEATAQANNLLTESLTEDILKKQAIEKWNGTLPTVLSDGSNILDLTGLN